MNLDSHFIHTGAMWLQIVCQRDSVLGSKVQKIAKSQLR